MPVFYIFVCFGISKVAMPACYASLMLEVNSVFSTMAINTRPSLTLYLKQNFHDVQSLGWCTSEKIQVSNLKKQKTKIEKKTKKQKHKNNTGVNDCFKQWFCDTKRSKNQRW